MLGRQQRQDLREGNEAAIEQEHQDSMPLPVRRKPDRVLILLLSLFIPLLLGGAVLVGIGVWAWNFPPGFIFTGLVLITVGVVALVSVLQARPYS